MFDVKEECRKWWGSREEKGGKGVCAALIGVEFVYLVGKTCKDDEKHVLGDGK